MKETNSDQQPTDSTASPSFWESTFSSKQEMWGLEPSSSALVANDYFLSENARSILVPGIGYGRNAAVFVEHGMKVSGIEISETAIELLKKHFGEVMKTYQGSVSDMPFDDLKYDGIFCYALIHLFDQKERRKLIKNCFDQLSPGGSMIFSVVSKTAPTYGKGKKIGDDRYELVEGAPLYFYNRESLESEFNGYGLIDIREVNEKPPKHSGYETFPFLTIICKKA